MKGLKQIDLRILAGIIIFGSMWGALEATLGGALGMYLSYVGTMLLFLYVTQKVPRFILADPWGWVLRSGGIAALFALVSVPLGWQIGRVMKVGTDRLERTHSWVLYSGATMLTLLCWVAGILTNFNSA